MTTLSIRRLTAAVPQVPGEPDLGPRVRVMLAEATGRPLGQALDARPLPAGHWFVRRLDVRLPLDLRRAAPGTEQQWANALALALQEAMLSGQAVHYRSEGEALADLVASAAVGRLDNQWAWQELGLVDGAVSGPADRAVLAACGRRPELALAATTTAIRRAGTGAVHRLLGSSGWLELARLIYEVHTGRPAPAWLAATAGVAAGPDAATHGATADPGPELGAPGRAAGEIAGRVAHAADGELARCLRHGRLRPDPGAKLAWAVLAAAETEPGLLMLPTTESAVRQLAAVLLPDRLRPDRATIDGGHDATDAVSGRSGQAAGPPGADAPRAVTADGSAQVTGTGARRDGTHAEPARGAGPADEPEPGWRSEWAGLLHLYRTAAEADVPAALQADDALSTRPLAWVLHAIASSLVPAAPDDPALLAFAGLLPADEPPSLTWRAAGRPELESIAGHAHRWLTVTAHRLLGDGEFTAQTVERLLHRPGLIFAERGWIDIEMPLDIVDIDIRRAGLDIDPGWIGWLGSVVRFRYV